MTTLADFAIVHWGVDADELQRHLPQGFEVAQLREKGGVERAFVGAVVFRDLDFRFAGLPWFRFRMGQTNYRTYVRHEGQDVAWFFGTTLSRPFVTVPRQLWKLPWHPARFRFDCSWQGERLESYKMATASRWAPAELQCTGTGKRTAFAQRFKEPERAHRILTHPTVGYYKRRDGHLGSYSIWRDRLDLEEAVADVCSFPLYERLGLIQPGQKPWHVLVQRSVNFQIRLPPTDLGPSAGPGFS